MNIIERTSRRRFLKATGAAVAAPYIITSTALGKADRPAASDRIVMGGIGIGNMGRGDQSDFLNRKDVQYVALCDVRDEVRDKSKTTVDSKYGNRDCTAYNDFRELLARSDIDAVLSPRRTIGTRSWPSKPAAKAKTFTAKSLKRSPCVKAR